MGLPYDTSACYPAIQRGSEYVSECLTGVRSNACRRYVEVHMLKTCRNQQELYTRGSLLEIDTKLRNMESL